MGGLIDCVVPESIHIPSKKLHWKLLGGGGDPQSQTFRKEYEAKLEFPGGGEVQNKKSSMRGVGIWNYTLVV